MKKGGKQHLLPECEWAFHKVPEHEHWACYRHEACREHGSGEDPWLLLPDSERTKRMGQPSGEQSVSELKPDDDVYIAAHRWLNQVNGRELHLLEIDWSASDRKLIASIKRWIAKLRKMRGTKASHWRQRGVDRGGKPTDPLSVLIDLAIYRASKARIPQRQAVQLLAPLLSHANLCLETGKASAKNWSTTVKRAANRLARPARKKPESRVW